MLDNLLKSQAFKLKGRLYTLTVLHVLTLDEVLFAEHLSKVISTAPKMFEHTPIVLDLSSVAEEAINVDAMVHCLREAGLIPVAIQGANLHQQTSAIALGLAVLGSSKAQDKDLIDEHYSDPVERVVETIKTKLLTTPVRSGQQVVSKGSDLVITSSVSHGAELLADGNIHVYGSLRGRALAGIDGNKQARIFCQSLDAELVSIAGFYQLRDAMKPPEGACQIYLQNDHIHIEPL